jgi:hypothetical protein
VSDGLDGELTDEKTDTVVAATGYSLLKQCDLAWVFVMKVVRDVVRSFTPGVGDVDRFAAPAFAWG